MAKAPRARMDLASIALRVRYSGRQVCKCWFRVS
jgi:hypothetical protein